MATLSVMCPDPYDPTTVICDIVNDNAVGIVDLHYRQVTPLPSTDWPCAPADVAAGNYRLGLTLVGSQYHLYRLTALIFDATGLVEAPAVSYQPVVSPPRPAPGPDPPLADVADWPDPVPANAAELLDAASAMVRQHCGWQISARVGDSVTLDYRGGRVLSLPSLHVERVESLTYLPPGLSIWPTPPLDPSRYWWYGNGIVRLAHSPAMEGPRRFEVVYDHGYDPVPPTVRNATVAVARNIEANPSGASSVRVGDVSVTYGRVGTIQRAGPAVLTDVEALLHPFVIAEHGSRA